MPCYDSRNTTDDLWGKIKDLEALLCDTLTAFEGAVGYHNLAEAGVPAEALSIWSRHEQQEIDKIRRETLQKLTPRERRILGLMEP